MLNYNYCTVIIFNLCNFLTSLSIFIKKCSISRHLWYTGALNYSKKALVGPDMTVIVTITVTVTVTVRVIVTLTIIAIKIPIGIPYVQSNGSNDNINRLKSNLIILCYQKT